MNDNDAETGRLDAAARWYSELQDPDVELETWDAFRAWERDPDNAAAYRQIEASLAIVDQGLRAGRGAALPEPARRTRLRTAAWLTGLAAALALAATVFVRANTGANPAPLTYATAVGEQRSVTLADGTVITLNTDTALDVAYSPRERHVSLLRGQALFEVEKAKAPFIVAAGRSRTRALGTQFEVYARPTGVAVTLLEGSVVVSTSPEEKGLFGFGPGSADPEGRVLTQGDRLEIAGDGSQTVSRVEPGAALQWRSGIVQFDDVTLAEAVTELNRYSTTQIRVSDPRLAAERLSGTFRTGAPEEFVANIALFLPIRIEQSDHQITLVPDKASAP
jgi:transmembrane sensor